MNAAGVVRIRLPWNSIDKRFAKKFRGFPSFASWNSLKIVYIYKSIQVTVSFTPNACTKNEAISIFIELREIIFRISWKMNDYSI